MSDISPLDALKVDTMKYIELQNSIVGRCKDITGIDNRHVTPIEVVEIVRKVFQLEPKLDAPKTP